MPTPGFSLPFHGTACLGYAFAQPFWAIPRLFPSKLHRFFANVSMPCPRRSSGCKAYADWANRCYSQAFPSGPFLRRSAPCNAAASLCWTPLRFSVSSPRYSGRCLRRATQTHVTPTHSCPVLCLRSAPWNPDSPRFVPWRLFPSGLPPCFGLLARIRCSVTLIRLYSAFLDKQVTVNQLVNHLPHPLSGGGETALIPGRYVSRRQQIFHGLTPLQH